MEQVILSRESYDTLNSKIEILTDTSNDLLVQNKELKKGNCVLLLGTSFFAKCEAYTNDEKVKALISEATKSADKRAFYFTKECTWLLRRSLWQRIINKQPTEEDLKVSFVAP